MNENDARTGESTIDLTLGDADTAGHGRVEFLDPGAEQRFKDLLAEKGGSVSVEVVESDQDTSGHAAADDTAAVVTLRIPGDDDTEGHAIAVHFPTARDARAFRNRLIVTGVIAGSVVAGAGAVALQSSGSEAASPAQAAAADSVYWAGDVAATVGHEDSFAGSTYSQADVEATVGHEDSAPASGGTETESSNPRVPGPR
jgi:hypothetical protein